MDRTISESEQDAIMNFGAFGYEPELMASILGWSIPEIEAALLIPNSEFNALLKRGRDMGMYAMDRKLWEMALGGDMKALDKIEARKAGRSNRGSKKGADDEVAKKTYNKYMAILKKSGNWKEEYKEQLMSAASNYSLLKRATEALEKEDAVITHSNGTHGQNPWVKIKGDCMKELMAFGRLFGFNPLYESKVKKNEDDDSEI